MNERSRLIRLIGGDAPEASNLLDAYDVLVRNERDAEIVAWLGKKASEYYSTGNRQHALLAGVIEVMASKIAQGAVRPCRAREAEPRTGTGLCVLTEQHGGEFHQDRWTNRWPLAKTAPEPLCGCGHRRDQHVPRPGDWPLCTACPQDRNNTGYHRYTPTAAPATEGGAR